MKQRDVKIGGVYAVKVSGRLVPVRITGESPYGGWNGLNLYTNREVRIRGAQRLRWEVQLEQRDGRLVWARVRREAAS